MSIFGSRFMAALSTMFNILALNTVLIIAALPVITLPAALNAATVALDRWRTDGEDRVVREFILALRSGSPVRGTVLTGVPLAAIALGLLEVRHFARLAAPADRAALGCTLGALLLILTAFGYLLLLAPRDAARRAAGQPSPAELWSLAARLAIRNLLVTGPLFLLEFAAAAFLTVLDPALLFLGVPVLLLRALSRTAAWGLKTPHIRTAVARRPGPVSRSR
jgi:hypothetical protein